MTPFLARLVERARGTAPRVKPIVASRFAPAEGPAPNLANADLAPEIPRPPAAPTRNLEAGPSPSPSRARDLRPLEDPARESLSRPARTRGESDAAIAAGSELVGEEFRPKKTPRLDRSAPPSVPTERAVNGRERRALAGEPVEQAPIVRITIGRIEVRAAAAPAGAARAKGRRVQPELTLDAYLKSRKDGAR